MNYFEIISRAWKITWQNKFLWIFGFFAAEIFSLSFNFSLPDNLFRKIPNLRIFNFSLNFTPHLEKYWFIFLFLGIIFIFIFLTFFVLGMISQGALIGCVNKLNNGIKVNIKEGFEIGFSKFWKVFGLYLVLGFFSFFVVLILGVPIFSLFVLKMYLRALILIIFSLIIFLPLIFVVFFVSRYALRFIVLKNLSVFESINFGFNLLKKNILSSTMVFLILIGVIIAINIGFSFLFPILFFGLFSSFLLGMIGKVFIGIPTILFLMFFTSLINAVYNTFSSTLWTLTFLEIEKGP